MKIANLTLTVLAIAACSATYAQGKPRMREATARPVFNAQALAAVQSDLGSALAAMTSALPIYDGDRVKSIHFAHRALVIVDGELAGGKAAFRKQPKVRDHVPSKTAHAKYTPQQIAASQTAMNQGLQYLQKAASDYQTATGGVTGTSANSRVTKAAGLIGQAIGEATAAIAIHAR